MRRRVPLDDNVSDEGLLAAIALRDEQATVVFVRRYQRRIFGLAYTIVGDRALADEIAQEAFIRIWRHAPVFDPRRASVTSWVLTITRNLAIDALRVRRSVPIDPSALIWLSRISPERQPDDIATLTDVVEKMRRALGDLPDEQRRAVVLAGIYGRSAAEIAEAESLPLGTVKGRIRAGIAKLRVALESEMPS